MEPEVAARHLAAIYTGVNGYHLSLAERKRENRSEWSLTYGEVLPAPFQRALLHAAPQPGESFVDLGAGLGKAVFLAAMLFDFSRVEGVELLEDLSRAGAEALARYDATVRPTLEPAKQQQALSLIRGNLLAHDVTSVDVVFVHGELFGRELLGKLGEKLAGLKSGARVVTIGPPLPGPHLTQQKTFVCEMDWGPAAATLYRRS